MGWHSWVREAVAHGVSFRKLLGQSPWPSRMVHHSWKHIHCKVIKAPLPLLNNSYNHYDWCHSEHLRGPNTIIGTPGVLVHLAVPVLLQRCTRFLIPLVSSYESCHRFLLGSWPMAFLFIMVWWSPGSLVMATVGLFNKVWESLFSSSSVKCSSRYVTFLTQVQQVLLLLWDEVLSIFSGNISLWLFVLRHSSLFWS